MAKVAKFQPRMVKIRYRQRLCCNFAAQPHTHGQGEPSVDKTDKPRFAQRDDHHLS
jgi:hypothetical protein